MRRIDRKTVGGLFHLFVGDQFGSDLFQCIDPAVANAVGELFFLTPGDLFGQHIGKGFAEDLLLDSLARTHFGSRVQAHGNVEKFFVEEGNTAFHTPGTEAFVGTQTII